MPNPNTIPLEDWSDGWLTLETATLLDNPFYLLMYAQEKKLQELPCTRQEMIDFIKDKRAKMDTLNDHNT
jgi:hypothetical protein